MRRIYIEQQKNKSQKQKQQQIQKQKQRVDNKRSFNFGLNLLGVEVMNQQVQAHDGNEANRDGNGDGGWMEEKGENGQQGINGKGKGKFYARRKVFVNEDVKGSIGKLLNKTSSCTVLQAQTEQTQNKVDDKINKEFHIPFNLAFKTYQQKNNQHNGIHKRMRTQGQASTQANKFISLYNQEESRVYEQFNQNLYDYKNSAQSQRFSGSNKGRQKYLKFKLKPKTQISFSQTGVNEQLILQKQKQLFKRKQKKTKKPAQNIIVKSQLKQLQRQNFNPEQQKLKTLYKKASFQSLQKAMQSFSKNAHPQKQSHQHQHLHQHQQSQINHQTKTKKKPSTPQQVNSPIENTIIKTKTKTIIKQVNKFQSELEFDHRHKPIPICHNCQKLKNKYRQSIHKLHSFLKNIEQQHKKIIQILLEQRMEIRKNMEKMREVNYYGFQGGQVEANQKINHIVGICNLNQKHNQNGRSFVFQEQQKCQSIIKIKLDDFLQQLGNDISNIIQAKIMPYQGKIGKIVKNCGNQARSKNTEEREMEGETKMTMRMNGEEKTKGIREKLEEDLYCRTTIMDDLLDKQKQMQRQRD